ncbi:hypothetical protein RHSIM_Rhsim10G0147000 [Rhododendron simsii]|uniref:GRF-type domain-containing protein n=1 Tax=Rhododendron simsii TaxID=118357 RepID=A0A834GBW7_RHOSS|nr:hypothetical protein RHSIM_Rhsim10G0147000 [Rhododendron simsii]
MKGLAGLLGIQLYSSLSIYSSAVFFFFLRLEIVEEVRVSVDVSDRLSVCRQMSSSSSYYRAESETKKGVTNTPKLLYKPRDCYCGTRADIKVVEKSEKSKGELYFICRKERSARCGFFDWCLPVEWTSSSKFGGWGSSEYTNVCASNVCATKVFDDVVALEKEVMIIRQHLEYSKMLTKFLAICLVIAMGVIVFK